MFSVHGNEDWKYTPLNTHNKTIKDIYTHWNNVPNDFKTIINNYKSFKNLIFMRIYIYIGVWPRCQLENSAGPGGVSSAVPQRARPEKYENPVIELGASKGKLKHPAYPQKEAILGRF